MATIDPYAPGPPPVQVSAEVRHYLSEELYQISLIINEILERQDDIISRLESLENP